LAHRGLLEPDDSRDMLAWGHGGFSLDASVCIASHDRPGLERLLRDCARPPFALEGIAQVPATNSGQQVVCLSHSATDAALSVTRLEFIDYLSARSRRRAGTVPYVGQSPGAPLGVPGRYT